MSSLARKRRAVPFGRSGGDALAEADGGKGLQKIIAASKTTGALNLSNRQLTEVPEGVFSLPDNDESVKWWEAVDLTKLDLTHNHLTALPGALWELTALVTLLASNNRLQQLLPGIGALQCLRMLDLSDNPLGPALPEDVALLPNLASLHCNSCGLQALPDTLGGPQQPKLSVLNAAGNELTALPAGLACAGALVVLKAGNNKLSKLPGGLVKGLKTLKELDLSHNQLEELPADLGQLPSLAELDLRNNKLAALPPALGDAGSLGELRLGFNKLSSLPPSLGMLRSLKTLDLRNNLIEELPDALCGLHLVLLDMTNNCLRRLPPALGHMTTLRSIPLDGNPLKLMRRELWAGPVSALLQHLRDQEQLSTQPLEQQPGCSTAASRAASGSTGGGLEGAVSLRGSGLTSVPEGVWQAGDRVSSLDVSDNSLAADAANLARHLPQLSSIKALAMNSCSLTSWPLAGLSPGCLGALQALELCSNSFGSCLPADGLAACPGLKSLDLSGVRDLRLPDSLFAATPQLEVLLACRAGLSELPPAVLGAASLTRLALGSNSISSLPVEVTTLTRLKELDVLNNQLSNLPPQMGLMAPTLRLLRIEGNCIRVIRRPVLEKGTAAVLEWLKDRIPA